MEYMYTIYFKESAHAEGGSRMFVSESDGTHQYSLTSKVFHEIKNGIIQGKYKEGESLVETKLARELGVSRTPVREAIRLLEFEGLVSYRPNRGAVVEGISTQDIDDIYAIRTMIEGLAARWAVKNINDQELAQLIETQDLMEFYASKDDIEHFTKLDTKFHEIIYRASKSRPLWQVLNNFHDMVQRVRKLSITNSGRIAKTVEEHRRIVDAIKAKDEKSAELAMTNHVMGVVSNLESISILAQNSGVSELEV